MDAGVAAVTAIVAVADIDTAAPVVADVDGIAAPAVGSRTMLVMDPGVVAARKCSAQAPALAIEVVTVRDYAFGAVLAAVGAFEHTVLAAQLVAACTTAALEAGHVVAEEVERAVQAAQNVLGPGVVVAVVQFGRVLVVAAAAAARDFEEDTVVTAVHVVAVSAAAAYQRDQIAVAEGEVAVLTVPLDSLVHGS